MELSFDARRFLEKIQPDFYDRTGKQLEITSGTRKPRRQAKAMYDNLKNNQHVYYLNQEAYNRIKREYDRLHNSPGGDQVTVDAMTRVIEEQVSRGVHISRHLSGKAIDVRNSKMSDEDKRAFEQVTYEAGGRINRQEAKSHYHVDLP